MTRLPKASKNRPVRRGRTVTNDKPTGAAAYRVLGSRKMPCPECEGHGYVWVLSLKSKYGPKLQKTLADLWRWRYGVAEEVVAEKVVPA